MTQPAAFPTDHAEPGDVVTPRPESTGPIFISGRQHSGNTVMSVVFRNVPDCLSQSRENLFFEKRAIIDRIADPRARARAVAAETRLDRLDEQLQQRAGAYLEQYAVEHPDSTALELFRQAMRWAIAAKGKTFWVQKATSYIFYAREILESIPDARIIYMLRNPYDICASDQRRIRRRGIRRESIFRTCVGWNKGVRLARAIQREFPDRFRFVKYEELVTKPEPVLRDLFAFLGLPFDLSYLEVPQVNTSETGYTDKGEIKGLNPSKVYKYRDALTPAQLALIDLLIWKEEVQREYPDVPHRGMKHSLGARLKALGMLAVAPFYRLVSYLTFFKRDPSHLLDRTLRRLRS